jgi:hypothetical protein
VTEINGCCFHSGFSPETGQAVYLASHWQESHGIAFNSITFLYCGHSSSSADNSGTITLGSMEGTSAPSLQFCNFTSCKVTGAGSAVFLVGNSGLPKIDYCLITKCSGISLIYSRRSDGLPLFSCGFYENKVSENGACLGLGIYKVNCTACIFDDSAPIYTSTSDISYGFIFTDCWFAGEAPFGTTVNCKVGETTKSYSWVGFITFLCPVEPLEQPKTPSSTATFTTALVRRKGRIWVLGIGWYVFVTFD